ncbi:MAG: hypothetical protein KIG51_08950, partial [Fibrobacter sp.]|nr:hypothetical protein [Fibrobacter sp.]
MIFDALVILAAIIGGGLLLFPVKVRFLFRVQKNAGKFEVRIFRKKVFTTEEETVEESEATEEVDVATAEEIRASEEDDFDDENPWKKEKSVEAKAPANEKSGKKAAEKSEEKSDKKKSEKSKKKSKKKSSDEEFLTLVLDPRFDKKLLKDCFQIAKAFFRIFHCYFEPTVVDGIRLEDYEDMGYAMGGLNFLCGTIPLFNNWEFLMDWEGNRPLKVEGGFVASFS